MKLATILAVSLLSGIAFGAVLSRTLVLQGADARVHSLQFDRQGDEIYASVCATVPQADGGDGLSGCEQLRLPNGALKTSVVNMMNGQALTIWRKGKALED